MKSGMKKVIAVIAAVIVLVSVGVASFKAGVRHAIEDSLIDAENSVVFIDLDGQVY